MPAVNDPQTIDPALLFDRPDWYLLEFQGPKSLMAQMDRNAYYRSPFLDRRMQPLSPKVMVMGTEQLVQMHQTVQKPAREICYVFHMAHCGSTLLSRALDLADRNMVYREPTPLRQLAAEAAQGFYDKAAPDNWQQRFEMIMALLSRSYQSSGPLIIKANVPVNFIMPRLMSTHPDTRAILLYSTLDNFLLSVLKEDRRDWVMHVVRELGNGIDAVINTTPEIRNSLLPAQAAACLWLAQATLFTKISEQFNNTRSLNSDVLFNEPLDALVSAFEFFQQDVAEPEVKAIVDGAIFSHHSKNPDVIYNRDTRRIERQQQKQDLSGAITRAHAWIESHASGFELPDKLIRPLTGTASQLI